MFIGFANHTQKKKNIDQIANHNKLVWLLIANNAPYKTIESTRVLVAKKKFNFWDSNIIKISQKKQIKSGILKI